MQLYYKVLAKNGFGDDVSETFDSMEKAKAFCEKLDFWVGTRRQKHQVLTYIGKTAPQQNATSAEQVERRNALAEGADGRHDCLQSTQPKYTREELVEIMCRANADLSPVGSDALVYFSMDDCATSTPSPNWHRDLHKMHTALSALIEAGALQVKQTDLKVV